VHVDESLITYLLNIVTKTASLNIYLSESPPRLADALPRRPSHGLPRRPRLLHPEDFKPLVVSVFAHRVVVSSLYTSTLKKSEQAEQVLREIVESVPSRYSRWTTPVAPYEFVIPSEARICS